MYDYLKNAQKWFVLWNAIRCEEVQIFKEK